MSPREIKRMMKRMGIRYEELGGVEAVMIKTGDKTIKLIDPQVIVLDMGGQKIYQIMARGEEVSENKEPGAMEEAIEINEEDIEFIVEQTGASREEARKALIESRGDIAEAILRLKGEGGT